jgi:RNA polymerase sigma-70 factor (sigma-E family)
MPDGFDDFVVARGAVLLRFAHVLCGNPHLAEDLVQEVLARVHRRWARIESMHAPEAYVRTAIVREFLSWRRRRASTEAVLAEVPDRSAEPDRVQQLAARDEMWTLLASLPPAQRAVLVLRFYEDLADDAIAEVLGCSQSSVRAQASRALTRLRAQLGHGSTVGVNCD